MKKYTLSILILIALIGLFSPIVKVNATPYSECVAMNEGANDCNGLSGQPVNSTPDACNLGARKVTFQVLTSFIVCNINVAVIPLIFALALVMFIWGVVRYVINSSDEAKKEQGRQFMIWGIIALTVMLCVWGLVAVLANTFGINVKIIPQVAVPAKTK